MHTHCLLLSLSSEEEDDDWCPPLPARTYLMDTSREELPSLPSKPDELSYTATLTSPHQQDASKPNDSPRLQHFDLLARHHLVSQSNPDLFTNMKAQDGSEVYRTSQWVDDFKGESLGKGQFEFSLMLHSIHTQPHSVMYNLVYDVTKRREFVHENHVAFIQSGAQHFLVFPVRVPEDDISVLSRQDNFLLQLQSRAPQPRRTDPRVRRKRPRMDQTREICRVKQV